jgi:hypothetical protein
VAIVDVMVAQPMIATLLTAARQAVLLAQELMNNANVFR